MSTLPAHEPGSRSGDHEFERAKASFEQNFLQFRHLNQQLNRVPTFAVTLTGGFWYIAVVVSYGNNLASDLDAWARFLVMVFASICDFMLVLISIRIRDVMSGYQEQIAAFEDSWWPRERPRSFLWYRNYSMISMYATLILAGSALSLAAAFILFWAKTRAPWFEGVLAVGVPFVLLPYLANKAPRWLTRQS
jgi:hypothetical protein